jgi:magnesium chelatase family protein
VSGPLLDRFDLRIVVDRPEVGELLSAPTQADRPPESTPTVAARVARARSLAAARGVRSNAELPGRLLDELAPLDGDATALLETRLRQGQLSARGLHRIRRVARTIADLGGWAGPVRAEDAYSALALRAPIFGREPAAWEDDPKAGAA